MKHCQSIIRACLLVMTVLISSVAALAQPTLTSVVPANQATGVATNVAVVFRFSEQMNPVQVMTWVALVNSTPVFIDSSMTYQWSVDGRDLTARCTGGFPSGATITWSMDKTEFTRTIDNSELAADYSGIFFTSGSSGGGGGGGGTGTAKLSLSYSANYDQFSGGAPILATSNVYFFVADVEAPASRNLASATLTIPGGAVKTLQGFPFIGPTNFFLGVFSNNLAQLQSAFPAGGYTFTLQASGSNQAVAVTLPTISFPGAPTFANYAAAQTVDPAQPFSIQFNAGGLATNYVFVQVNELVSGNTVFESPDFGTLGALTGTSNNVRLAAGILQAGRTYELSIQRWSAFTNSVPGAVSVAGFGTSTRSLLRTTGGAADYIVRLAGPAFSANTFSVRASLATNATYHFERTVDFTNWTSLSSIVPSSTNAQTFTDTNPTNKAAFYRFRRE